MRIFEDFERDDPNPSYPLEKDYNFYDRIKNKEYNKIRNIINSWFSEYPLLNRKKLLADFKSDFYSAFYELYMFTFLKNLGFKINVEFLDETTNSTPDFLCTELDVSFYVESTVTNGKSDAQIKMENTKESIYEMMRKIDTPNYFLNIEAFDLFTDKQPKTKFLLQKIQSEITRISSKNIRINADDFHLDSYPRVHHKDKDFEIIVSFIQKNPGFYQNVSHPIGMFPVKAEFVDMEDIIPKALNKKLRKYKKLSKPLIVAINATESCYYNEDDLKWFLYGNIERYGQINDKPIFGSEKAKNLIGVIVTSVFPVNIQKSGLDIYLNPEFDNAKSYLSKFNLENPEPSNINIFHLHSVNNILNIPEDWLDEIWSFN